MTHTYNILFINPPHRDVLNKAMRHSKEWVTFISAYISLSILMSNENSLKLYEVFCCFFCITIETLSVETMRTGVFKK